MKYSKELVKRITMLVEEDTYTIAEICEMAGVSESVFYKWKTQKADFVEALKTATCRRDQKLVSQARHSLRRKIQGFTTVETKTTYVLPKDETHADKLSIKERVVNEKYHAPDTSAIVFTLTNRDAENWRNKHSTELSGTDGTPIAITVANDATKKELEALQKSA